MCMEQKEETANEHVPPIASEPVQSFRSLLADALMAVTPLPVMLFCAWLVRDEDSFPEFPFIILGAYLLAVVTTAATAWRMLRCADSGSFRTRSFFVSSASLLLSAPYLVVYWTAGAGGNGDPWWGPVAFVLFMAHVPVLFLERQRWRRNISFMCMCARGGMLSSYAPGLAPMAILLLYLLENRSLEPKSNPS